MLKFSKTGKTASQEQLHNTKMSSQRLEQDMGSLSLSEKSRLPPTTAPTFYTGGKKFAPVVAPKPKKSQVQAAYQAQKTTEYSPTGTGARTQENYASYYSTTRLYIEEGTEDDLPPPPPPAFEGVQPARYDDDDFPPPPPPQEMTSYSSEPLPPPPNVGEDSFPPPPPETSYSKRSNGYAVTRTQEQYNPSPTNLPSSTYSPSPAQSYSPQPSRTYTPPSSTRSYSPTTPSQSTYNPPRTYTPPQSNYTPSNTYNSYSPTSTYSSSSSSYSTPGSYNRTAEKSTSQPYTPQQPRVNVNPSPSYSSPNSNIPSFNVSVNSPVANPASPQPQRSGGVTLTKSPEEELDVLTKCLVDKMENPETDFFGGICGNCGQKVIVDEEGCSAMDKVFHVKCFTCTTCGGRLSGKPFYAMENHPYCEECYINSLEKCSVCSKPIMERILRATGKPYHPACFTCVVCGKSLDGIPFTVDATNQIHCIEDFHKKFAPRCSVCHEPIMPEPGQEETIRIVAMDRSFHVGCYKCEDCGMVLSSEADGRGCYPLDDHILCRDCNAKRIQALSARISTEL
ncbi:thyroid receptor-interacting protein 6-like isoform X3 [Branchiostoma floridae]|uniref:Thyroid receptor-interacting protein 6-like isoform X3 n=2 Tax=Branchiostoma floridae TaxID=7739 RepID=A0A9J7M8C1_BRAFL|nr:thyroid receptor-interacting protein 6-like isoform X3 [Branchiostoma floridae]XP_035696608.1 thyroid receptor-interacting protein 6-like isoform X3 [Branchiostoma floridae]XP_035696609.1 thyroid receptor-interacting protein 6-like isoform X3 [Branchiostoma floridae]XP_035696610.1 thyroid receptor-interacting protein 6-like isoform X3 [Branchiostoma floridae]